MVGLGVDGDDRLQHVVGMTCSRFQRFDRLVLRDEGTVHRADFGFEHDEHRFGQIVVAAGLQPFQGGSRPVEGRGKMIGTQRSVARARIWRAASEAVHDRHHDVETAPCPASQPGSACTASSPFSARG